MKFSESIKELEALSSFEGVYSKDKVEWWLNKHKLRHEKLSKNIDTLNKEFPNTHVRSISILQNEAKFLDIYEALLEVIECYSNELYYKGEMELYSTINDDKIQLDSWLQAHKLDEGKKQSKFKQLFQNTSTFSGYEFVIRYPLSLPVTIKLDEAEFKYTLKFLEILERSSKTQFIGVINIINDLEVFEKKVTKTDEGGIYRRAFTRRSMIITVDDIYGSELHVRFMDERTQLIENLKAGQEVKLYADITGKENESDRSRYPLSLLGWDIEIFKQVTNGDNRKNKSLK